MKLNRTGAHPPRAGITLEDEDHPPGPGPRREGREHPLDLLTTLGQQEGSHDWGATGWGGAGLPGNPRPQTRERRAVAGEGGQHTPGELTPRVPHPPRAPPPSAAFPEEDDLEGALLGRFWPPRSGRPEY